MPGSKNSSTSASYDDLSDGLVTRVRVEDLDMSELESSSSRSRRGWLELSSTSARWWCGLFAIISIALAAVTGAMYFGAIKTKGGSTVTPTLSPEPVPLDQPATKITISTNSDITVDGVANYSMPDRLKVCFCSMPCVLLL
jgi:hypothetical protein